MSINMFLPEVQQQTESVEALCKSYISGMEEVKRNIGSFAMEFRLRGRTYESAKTYFTKTYIPLADGIILLSEAIIRAHQQFPDRYVEEVDSNSLQSSELEAQILRIESSIQSLKAVQKAMPLTILSTAGAIAGLRFMQSKVKDKLQRLITFDGSSPNIFSEIDQLLSDVETGLAEVSSGRAWSAANGSFDTDKLDMAWAENIKEKKFVSDLEKEVNPVLKELDSESQQALKKEYKKYKNGEMSPEDFDMILTAYKQKSIGWEGQKGGYEIEEVWKINLELNLLKHEQDHGGGSEALRKEKELRAKYPHLEEYLIDPDDNPHELGTITLDDGSTLEYRIDNEGYLHYKAELGYEYSEETHKQTKAQQYHGVIGKSASIAYVTRGIGLFVNIPSLTTAGAVTSSGLGGAGTELLDEYRVPGVYVPEAGEVKTMIFRTDKETGKTELLIVDSKGNEIESHSQWKNY